MDPFIFVKFIVIIDYHLGIDYLKLCSIFKNPLE